jgi:NADPH:quinone reductase-like Zn-dependent oxidoreductase
VSGSGEVLGSDLTRLKVRDEIFSRPDISRDTAYAEFIFLKESKVALKPKLNAAQLAEIAKLADADKLKTLVETILPHSDATRGHELSERGHTRGKIVLRVVLAPE